jgi:hypothetical protein
MANNIGTAISSHLTSTMETRRALVENGRTLGRTKRNLSSEAESKKFIDWKYHKIVNHYVYDPSSKDFTHYPGLPPGALRDTNADEATRRQWKPPPFLAINRHHCGKGAERFAFRCQLSDDLVAGKVVLGEMVAKETLLVERIEENVAFHKSFLEAQDLAAHLADEFNQRLCALPDFDPERTPKISFLPCSVLLLQDSDWPGGVRGLLVEKMLDITRHGWCKWNDNAGGVDGRAAHIPIEVDYELKMLNEETVAGGLGDIFEEDSDDEESDDSEEDTRAEYGGGTHYNPSNYLQAFTHFTYMFTNKKVMVCDLQGVFNRDTVPPTFELTDPVIHYTSKRGRKMVFGRTDMGKKGTQLFFNTHKCSNVCKLMQLSKQNMQWREEWHGRHRNGRNLNRHGSKRYPGEATDEGRRKRAYREQPDDQP